MRFSPAGKYAQLSEDKRYSVAAFRHSGEGWIFQAFRVKGEIVLWTGTQDLCYQACRDDAAGVNTSAECYVPALADMR